MKKNKKPSNKLIPIALGVIAILVGGWFWFTSAGASSANPSQAGNNPGINISSSSDDINAVQPDDITKGNPQAKAVLIEYGDFQCGACKYMHETFKLVWRVVQDDLLVVYRHYPLNQHAHARMAASYSEAMNRQGKFWPFHDKVYDGQQDWEKLSTAEAQKKFEEYIKEIGGDVEKAREDADDPAIGEKIKRDMEFGDSSGLTGTPTLILNGRKISIPNDLAKFVNDIKNLNKP